MEICFKLGDQWHSYVVPVVKCPIALPLPGPGRVNFPRLVQDAVVLASLQTLANKLSDGDVREAVLGGICAATGALQRRGGEHVSVIPDETAGGKPTGGGAHGPGRKDD